MMRCVIISVGGKHDRDLVDRIAMYEQRLRSVWDVQWLLLPHVHGDEARVRAQESAQIASKLKDDDLVVLLDERGSQLTSPALADRIETWRATNKRVAFIIGGAYGVDDLLTQRASFTLSLSQLVFPHQLVRVILIEQLYRAAAIIRNHPYHHA